MRDGPRSRFGIGQHRLRCPKRSWYPPFAKSAKNGAPHRFLCASKVKIVDLIAPSPCHSDARAKRGRRNPLSAGISTSAGAPSLRSLQGWDAMLPVAFLSDILHGLHHTYGSVTDPTCAGVPDSRPSQKARRTGHPTVLFLPPRLRPWAQPPGYGNQCASFQYSQTPKSHRMWTVSNNPPTPAATMEHFISGLSERNSFQNLACACHCLAVNRGAGL